MPFVSDLLPLRRYGHAYGMVWYGMVDVCGGYWLPKRPGPASDRDSVTRQTLQAYVPHLPRNPYPIFEY